jgi:hypothetical protein
MFGALIAHPQEAPQKTAFDMLRAYVSWQRQCCCGTTAVKLKQFHSQLTIYARNIPNTVCAATPEDEQVMLETYRDLLILNKLNEKCITLVSLY